ncbi:MAG: hypothetical protein IKD69_04915 [Solobacterium sp.]|nr:hypothetical protein [Solobacterium sp.]
MCVGLKLYVEEQTRQKDAALKRKDTALKRKDDALKRKDKKIESLTADNRQKNKEIKKTFVKIAKRYGASLESVISDYAAEYHVAPATAKKEVMAFWAMA